jgi:hypothetical protein
MLAAWTQFNMIKVSFKNKALYPQLSWGKNFTRCPGSGAANQKQLLLP